MTHIDIVFDGPPGHETGRFVEVENAEGRSVHVGEWLQRPDGYWVLRIKQEKDAAYLERNKVVAALASLFPSGIARTAIPGWSDDWHGCVYIDLPTGQASWHYHDSHAHLFARLPPYAGQWDGHTTEKKYARLASLRTPVEPVLPGAEGVGTSPTSQALREALHDIDRHARIVQMEAYLDPDAVASAAGIIIGVCAALTFPRGEGEK